jgi:hypothetical protein
MLAGAAVGAVILRWSPAAVLVLAAVLVAVIAVAFLAKRPAVARA